MRTAKRLFAWFLAGLMLAAVLPAFAIGNTSGRLTQRQREQKIASLMTFAEKLNQMKTKYAPRIEGGSSGDPYCTARIIVKYAGALSYEGAVCAVSGHNDWHVIQYRTPEEAKKAAKAYSDMEGVVYAQPDMLMKVEEASSETSFYSWGYDPDYIDAEDFNNWMLGQAGSAGALPTVTVAVVDTGADLDHPFLVERLVQGYDVIDNDHYPEDGHGHGTHVSGTIIDGTLPNVRIMPIRVLGSDGHGDTTGVCIGMEYAYLNGALVENLSLGGDCDMYAGEQHRMTEEVINAAYDNGTVICVAAGNESDDAVYHCPANVRRACTVAALNDAKQLAYFSNRGPCVDVSAPGVNIYSAIIGGGFGYKSGTSMACPHVSAVAAMVKSVHPELNADAVVNYMKSSAKKANSSGAGFGIVNVKELFKYDIELFPNGSAVHLTSGGNYAWTSAEGYVKSGNASHDGTSSHISFQTACGSLESVTFSYKVSSEEGHDLFTFKCGNQTLLSDSGEKDWKTVTITLPQNEDPLFTWTFSKDSSGKAGSDCVMLRDIVIKRTLTAAANMPGSMVEFSSAGEYPWVSDETRYAAKNGNSAMQGTVSEMTASAELEKGQLLRFCYSVTAKSPDRFKLIINGVTVLTVSDTNGSRYFDFIAPKTGEYELKFRFEANSASSSAFDGVWVRDFTINETFASSANGTEDHLPFINDDEYPWFAIDGTVCSGNIGIESSTSVLSLTLDMLAGETLSFEYSVSSEEGYDMFVFRVNGSKKIETSGEISWRSYSFTAPSNGTYNFEWSYKKDGYTDSGYDRAYVDSVIYSGRYCPVSGDINGDGLVTSSDALLALRYALGLIGGSALDLAEADMNGDGVVDSSDALIILRRTLGTV